MIRKTLIGLFSLTLLSQPDIFAAHHLNVNIVISTSEGDIEIELFMSTLR